MQYIGKIDFDIYRCISDSIVSDDVIITLKQIDHINESHSNAFEKYGHYLSEIVQSPDFIIESQKPNTALILKELTDDENRRFKTVLRLITSTDDVTYKNSIITFMKIDDKEWTRLLRNKKILYKRV